MGGSLRPPPLRKHWPQIIASSSGSLALDYLFSSDHFLGNQLLVVNSQNHFPATSSRWLAHFSNWLAEYSLEPTSCAIGWGRNIIISRDLWMDDFIIGVLLRQSSTSIIFCQFLLIISSSGKYIAKHFNDCWGHEKGNNNIRLTAVRGWFNGDKVISI